MEIKNDVFSFEDFLAGKIQKPAKSKTINKVVESIVEDEVKDPEPPVPVSQIVDEIEVIDEVEIPEQEYEEEYEEEKEEEIVSPDESFYPLYKDKPENFSCDIYVEGAKTDETITRLIVETEDWTLMFPGEIKNGKVNIPIRKLNLFEEDQRGTIKLEVIAEGTVFIPWQDEFKIKISKKVTVSMNENKKQQPINNSKVGVKVNVRK